METIMRRRIEGSLDQWLCSEPDHPLIVKGVRRCGKTTVIEEFCRRNFQSYVKLDFQTETGRIESVFDRPTDDVDGIVRAIEELKHTKLDRESSAIFLDEVQLNERALNSLRFFSGSGWRVIASGSLFGVALRQRRLPFPSGVRQIQMHPMDFEEWLWAMGEGRRADEIRSHAQGLEPYVAHDETLALYHRYLVVGGMPRAVCAWVDGQANSLARVAVEQAEVNATYTADMTNPDYNISGISAKRIWDSIGAQLLRSSTKKFKYAEVIRGGRRARLMEPLVWLEAAGFVDRCNLTEDIAAPLAEYDEEEGSFFKVYLADTGIMFRKFDLSAERFLAAADAGEAFGSSDFRGALAENFVAQALKARDLRKFYWRPPSSWGTRGELDFLLQTDQAQVIPIEVKSARNVRAKTLSTFMQRAASPYAIILSENDFALSHDAGGQEIRHLPLYAAFCIGDGCARES